MHLENEENKQGALSALFIYILFIFWTSILHIKNSEGEEIQKERKCQVHYLQLPHCMVKPSFTQYHLVSIRTQPQWSIRKLEFCFDWRLNWYFPIDCPDFTDDDDDDEDESDEDTTLDTETADEINGMYFKC